MRETNSPSIAHVGYDISPLSRVKLKILTITHGQLKENIYICYTLRFYFPYLSLLAQPVTIFVY